MNTALQTLDAAVQLNQLAKRIRNRYDELTAKATQIRMDVDAALADALELGLWLNQAKGMVQHGQWLKWLARECPDVQERTAQRYMTLAKASHVTDLTANTLRQAYIEVEILPPDEPASAQPTAPALPALRLPRLDYRARAAQWTPEQRNLFVAWYDQTIPELQAIRAEIARTGLPDAHEMTARHVRD